jgi:hypothetical protein
MLLLQTTPHFSSLSNSKEHWAGTAARAHRVVQPARTAPRSTPVQAITSCRGLSCIRPFTSLMQGLGCGKIFPHQSHHFETFSLSILLGGPPCGFPAKLDGPPFLRAAVAWRSAAKTFHKFRQELQPLGVKSNAYKLIGTPCGSRMLTTGVPRSARRHEPIPK